MAIKLVTNFENSVTKSDKSMMKAKNERNIADENCILCLLFA